MLSVVTVPFLSCVFVLQVERIDFGPKSNECSAGDHMGVEVLEDSKGCEQQIGLASG